MISLWPLPRRLEACKSLFQGQLYRESVLVKPVNTPITPLCSEFNQCHPHLTLILT